MRVLFVSDTHLATRTPEARSNWAALLAHIDSTAYDAVVHLGDISADGARQPEDLEVARTALDVGPRHIHRVPGNHDVGDQYGGRGTPEVPVTAALVDHHRARMGPDRWRLDVGAWRLLAIDAQLFGSGLTGDEDAQWAWLADELRAAAADPVIAAGALLSHKPTAVLDASHDDARSPSRYLPPSARGRLRELLEGSKVRLVVSGHLHQRRTAEVDGRTHVWVPSAWATLPDRIQPTLGEKRCGVAAVTLRADGGAEVAFVEPPGLEQYEVGTNAADPYSHDG